MEPDRGSTSGNYVTVCVYEDDVLDVPDIRRLAPVYKAASRKLKKNKGTKKKKKKKNKNKNKNKIESR